jgi:hypothetical protein
MARMTIPMPNILVGEALADRPNRSYIPTLLLGALEDCEVFMRHLLACKVLQGII